MEPDWMKVARKKGLVITEGPTAKIEPAAEKRVQGVTLSEVEFQGQVIDLAQSLGWKVASFRKVRVQRKNGDTYWETPVAADGKGFLDLELVRPPRVLKAELKVGDNTTTPEQEDWIALYAGCPGVECYVWWPAHWLRIVEVLREGN